MQPLTLQILEAATDYDVFSFLDQFPKTHESFEGVETVDFIHDDLTGLGYVLVTYY